MRASAAQETAPRRWWSSTAILASVGVLLAAVWFGGAIVQSRVTGLPDAGRVTAFGLPIARLLADLAGAVTVGAAVSATFLLPGLDRTVGPAAYRQLRLAGLAALVWAAAAAALLLFTVSDILGQPVADLSPRTVLSFGLSVAQGQALVAQLVLALVVAIAARVSIARTAALAATVLAIVGLLPPAFTGHAAGAGNHQLAVSSLAVHVLAAALWAGGLVSLITLRPRRLVAEVAPRYSRLALVCFAAVAIAASSTPASGWAPGPSSWVPATGCSCSARSLRSPGWADSASPTGAGPYTGFALAGSALSFSWPPARSS